MASFDIQNARKGDATILARLSRRLVEAGLTPAWTEARIERCRSREDSRVLVARAGAGVIGGAILDFEDSAAHLGLLVIDGVWQRRGMGLQLITAVEASALAAGLPRIVLEVRSGNTGGRAFYAALGYQEVDVVARYYGPGEDAIRLRIDLPAGRISRS